MTGLGTVVLGCIGDDYTGSSDLANALTRAGLRTIQTIGVPGDDLELPAVDALVIALKSRSVGADEAVAMTLAARTWLKARKARHLMFKICSTFDSTDAGNIGPVMDALIAAEAAPFVLVTSAFPATRRTIYRGNLFVGKVPLNESSLKDHPRNPMRDANLVRLLGRQSHTRVGLIDLEDVDGGDTVIESRIGSLKATGYGAAIVDCVSDRELVHIGRAALRMPVSVGASGLGVGLARALMERGDVMEGVVKVPVRQIGGPVAMISGSCSEASLRQIAAAERWAQVLRLDTQRLLSGTGETQRAIEWTRARLGGNPVLIASSAPPHLVQLLQASQGEERASRAIEDALASIAAALVEAGVRKLIVAGGETAGAVVNRIGSRAFSIGAEIAPGIPLLHTIGDGAKMTLVLKSGNFGADSFFADAVNLIN